MHCGVCCAAPLGVRERKGPTRGGGAPRSAYFDPCSSEIVFLFRQARGAQVILSFFRAVAEWGTRTLPLGDRRTRDVPGCWPSCDRGRLRARKQPALGERPTSRVEDNPALSPLALRVARSRSAWGPASPYVERLRDDPSRRSRSSAGGYITASASRPDPPSAFTSLGDGPTVGTCAVRTQGREMPGRQGGL